MIHKYKLNKFNIVLDVNTGLVYKFDDIAFDILDAFDENGNFNEEKLANIAKGYSDELVSVALLEIKNLISQNLIFSRDNYDYDFIISKYKPVIKSMCLNVSHDCNLKCRYCFASHGNFGGRSSLMSLETACMAIDFLIKKSSGRKKIEIDFFGGEPLINFSVIKQTVEYAEKKAQENSKNIKFTITTNGLLLDDEKISFINKKFSNIVLSLDGRRNINDYMRQRLDGSGTYDILIPKFKKLIKQRNGKNYYIRGTFTRKNLDFLEDLLEIHNLGFDQISLEPVLLEESIDYAIKNKDLSIIFSEYEKMAEFIINLKKKGTNINFFHFMLKNINSPCVIKRIKGCGCGSEYIAITPEGDIFPCHQFVGINKFNLGNLHKNSEKIDNFFGFETPNILSSTKCQACWAKFFCGGGCRANNWNFNKNLNYPYEISCYLEKKRIECSLMIKAALAN
ncbi:MAG: thioether cross-link-forming SCIFF peptide maturase [Candidatus Improbicoccus devescovinae]|nr:MAG: thioether cross-link-forming SCIFF peptide maturase [Candidatus Improbicoccus devescovinae]